MDIKLELIQNYICDMIKNIFQSDFDAIEEIVHLLEENNIDCGSRHDF